MNQNSGFRQGLGIAFRVGIEMTVATLIGALMGYATDHFLGTKPWFMVAGVFLGGAAGSISVYHTASRFTFDENDKDHEGNGKED